MTDTDLHVALMESGRMNLMHLPAGAISWLWDRPTAQIDAAEALAVAANAYGNPVVDASLLKADQNVLLIKCEGGECFSVYPDGGYSCDGAPMDIGGCSSTLQGMQQPECAMDENGHRVIESDYDDPAYEKGMDRARDMEDELRGDDELDDGFDWLRDMQREKSLETIGDDLHLDDEPPESGVASPQGMTNLAGEPTMDEDQGGDWGGPGASTMGGTGTGSPYVGDMDMSADPELENLVTARELGEANIHMFRNESDEELSMLAEALGLTEMFDDMEYTAADAAADEYADMETIKLEAYDDSRDDLVEFPVTLEWYVEPREYEGPFVSYQGGANVEKMILNKPVVVNGKTYTGEVGEELAALVLATYNIDAAPGKAEQSLAEYIESQKDFRVPEKRYAAEF